jgi:hypothetical protein
MLKTARFIVEKCRSAAAEPAQPLAAYENVPPPSFGDEPTDKTCTQELGAEQDAVENQEAKFLEELSMTLDETQQAEVVTQVVRIRRHPRTAQLIVIREW